MRKPVARYPFVRERYSHTERCATAVAASALVEQFPNATALDLAVALFDGTNVASLSCLLQIERVALFKELTGYGDAGPAERRPSHRLLRERLASAAPQALRDARRGVRAPGSSTLADRAELLLLERFGANQ